MLLISCCNATHSSLRIAAVFVALIFIFLLVLFVLLVDKLCTHLLEGVAAHLTSDVVHVIYTQGYQLLNGNLKQNKSKTVYSLVLLQLLEILTSLKLTSDCFSVVASFNGVAFVKSVELGNG